MKTMQMGSSRLFIEATPLVSFHRTPSFGLSEFGEEEEAAWLLFPSLDFHGTELT